MSYCYEAGLAHSVFLSWEPNDRAKTIAYALEKGERCSSCGTAPWEWQADPEAYVAVRQQCPGCMRRETVVNDSKDPPPGTAVVLITKSHAEDIRDHPERHQLDGPQVRRARRQAAEAERLAREAAQ